MPIDDLLSTVDLIIGIGIKEVRSWVLLTLILYLLRLSA